MRINFFLLNVAALVLFNETASFSNSRIIGGTDARAGEFPYAAAIYVQPADSRFFCGGVLMRSQWVFTSGNCVYNGTLFTIQLGSATLTQEDPNRETVASSEYFLHPDFDIATMHADIGLIKLRMSITETNYIQNANFYVPQVPEDTKVIVLGWGQTNEFDAELSEHVQYVEIVTLSNEECQKVYGDQITDSMVCAEGSYNQGTCIGDTGGPLLRKSETVERYYVVGVASFISSTGCESINPSGFTRIAPYYVWLTSIMGQ